MEKLRRIKKQRYKLGRDLKTGLLEYAAGGADGSTSVFDKWKKE